jgi:hypothetical protein
VGAAVELRCDRHLHAIVEGDVLTVRCSRCTADARRRGETESILHRWRWDGERWQRVDEESPDSGRDLIAKGPINHRFW